MSRRPLSTNAPSADFLPAEAQSVDDLSRRTRAATSESAHRSTRKNRPRRNLVEIATRLAGQRALWEPLVRYDPISRYYARLAKEPDFEAWLLTWVPGQGTEWHDHGGSAGAFVVTRGELTERSATVSQDGPPSIVDEPRVLSDGSLRAFGTKHIHRVTNNGLEPAVSVHVYSPALVEMTSYAEDGRRLWQTGSQLIGVNW
jgi:mannose-6-phosphate isomerase-like protein (cupin superfamily)